MVLSAAMLGFVFIAIIAIVLLVTTLLYWFAGSPNYITRREEIGEILAHAKLKKGDRFLDLGSGIGTVVRDAYIQFGANPTGVEINPVMVLVSRALDRLRGIPPGTISYCVRSVTKADYKGYDVIYMFLFPALIARIVPRLEKQAQGAMIVSHGFKVPGWENKLIDTVKGDPYSTYYYTV
jgi:SAM-dependent methyltransferase